MAVYKMVAYYTPALESVERAEFPHDQSHFAALQGETVRLLYGKQHYFGGAGLPAFSEVSSP